MKPDTRNNHINYLEFYAPDLDAIKDFYGQVFGWTFIDYGPDYIAFENAGLDGGFERKTEPISNGVLVVLYHNNLSEILQSIMDTGGQISKDIFDFPGGKRFHFTDPAGNELAVWSEQ